MTRYFLSPNIGFARFEDCGIVLDVEADRYWQLDARLAGALDGARQQAGTFVEADDLARLEHLKLIVPSVIGAELASKAVATTVTMSAIEACPARTTSLRDVIAIWRVAVMGWAWVKYGRLATTLERVRKRRMRARTAKGDLADLARSFARHRRAVPIRPVCLADSLAFLTLAAERGHYPVLVFGVTAHPFAAHCWVQSGDMALTDHVDHVAAFQPILLV